VPVADIAIRWKTFRGASGTKKSICSRVRVQQSHVAAVLPFSPRLRYRLRNGEAKKKEFGHRQDAQLLPPEASANSLLIRNLFSLAPAARRFQDGNEEKSSRVLVLGPKRNPFSLETLATTFQPLLIRDMSAGRQHPTENQSRSGHFFGVSKNHSLSSAL
jgi:hypothetical protein